MRHMTTTLALGIWSGFFAIWSVKLAAAGGAIPITAVLPIAETFGFHDPLSVPSLPAHAAVAFAALFAALAIGAGHAIVGFSTTDPRAIQHIEGLVAALMAATIAFYASAWLIGSPVAACFGEGPAFLFCVALTLGAMLFDRLLDVEEDVAGDAAFEAALRSLRKADSQAIRDNWHAESGTREETR